MSNVSASVKFERELIKVTQFYDNAYALAHIDRYSMKPVLKHESVAEHSYFVALGATLLHEVYAFNLGTALLIAICHDVPEMEISDINHLVKKNHPSLAREIKVVEKLIIARLPGAVRDGAEGYLHETVEAKIVHLADAMQCMQYSTSEIRMGNSGYMEEVYKNSSSRVNLLHSELKGFRRWQT